MHKLTSISRTEYAALREHVCAVLDIDLGAVDTITLSRHSFIASGANSATGVSHSHSGGVVNDIEMSTREIELSAPVAPQVDMTGQDADTLTQAAPQPAKKAPAKRAARKAGQP